MGGSVLLSAVVHEEGEGAPARKWTEEALALFRGISDGNGVADSLLQLGEIHWRSGGKDEARKTLGEATDLLRQQQRKPKLAQALALLANLPGGDADEAEAALEGAGDAGNTPQTRYYLWKATGKPEHLAEAKRLLDYRVEHAPEEYRESMLTHVRLNRESMEAWEEHGGDAE